MRTTTAAGIVLGLSLGLWSDRPLAGQTGCPAFTAQTANQLTQEFPPGASMQTAWRVTYGHAPSKGLFITGAFFKSGPAEPWMRVLWDARLSDIFVPYHPGSPRYYDLSAFNFNLVPVASVDLGYCGKKADAYVVKEVRDRGMLWKDDQQGRRGHELVLWATLDAANYNYIMQYGFRDDGSINFRLGGTARNLPGAEGIAHMHDGLWRVDIDLNGFPSDRASLHKHTESIAGPVATDTLVSFNGGVEGSAEWNDLEFTEVNVQDNVKKNAQGKFISYDLMVTREGTPRHQEAFAHQDFWVTRYRPTEMSYPQLPAYVANKENITNTDVVLWHISPAHHMPRSEDGRYQGNVWKGVALAMWTGFDLRPRNLFDTTPLFP